MKEQMVCQASISGLMVLTNARTHTRTHTAIIDYADLWFDPMNLLGGRSKKSSFKKVFMPFLSFADLIRIYLSLSAIILHTL